VGIYSLCQHSAWTAGSGDLDPGISTQAKRDYRVYGEGGDAHLQDLVDLTEQDRTYGYNKAEEVVRYGSCANLESLR